MDYSKNQEINRIYIIHIIEFIFSSTGLIFYLVCLTLFNFYYKCPSLIKLEIFSFIFAFSVRPILEIVIPPSIINILISYILKIASFYLIIEYLNKCLTSKKILQDSFNYELANKKYLYIIFCISSFPLNLIFSLSRYFIFTENIINIIITIVFYRYIKSKFLFLIEYLNEKRATNSKIPDIYLPYMKAHYYYISFNSSYKCFFYSCMFIICSFSANILSLSLQNIFLRYISKLLEKLASFLLVVGCLILFYSLYKKFLGIGKNDEAEEDGSNISNFTVIDVDIQQDEKEENTGFTIRNKKDRKNNKNKEDDNNYIKIEGEEIKEKEKDNNIKANEETESLNK